MNRKDIIRMATEAGMHSAVAEFNHVLLERFAALVAAAEREACAKVCDAQAQGYEVHGNGPDGYNAASNCAYYIRARGGEAMTPADILRMAGYTMSDEYAYFEAVAYPEAAKAEIEQLQARVAHLTLDIENLRAAVREACLIFSEHVLTQDIDGATDRAAYDYLAAHSIPEEKP